MMSTYNESSKNLSETESLLDYDNDFDEEPYKMSDGCKLLISDFKTRMGECIQNFSNELNTLNYSEVFEQMLLDGPEIDELNLKIKSLEGIISTLTEQLEIQRLCVEKHKTQFDVFNSDFLQSKTNNKILSDNITILKDKLVQLKEHNNILNEDVDFHKKKVEKLHHKNKELLSHQDKISQDLEIAEVSEDQALAKLEDSLSSVKDANSIIKKNTLVISEQKLVIQNLDVKIYNLEQKLQGKDLEITSTKQSWLAMRQTYSKLNLDISNLTKKLEKSRSEIFEKTQTNNELSSSLYDAIQKNKQLLESQNNHNLDMLSLVCENKKMELDMEVEMTKPKKSSTHAKNPIGGNSYNLRSRNK